jgi:hypothetical protein
MAIYAYVLWDGPPYFLQGFIDPSISRDTPALWGRGPCEFFLGMFMLIFRRRLYGVLGRRWAKARMVDGAKISVLLENVTYFVGMDYWLHRPDLCDDPECTRLRCDHPTCNSKHTNCECQIMPHELKPADRWVKAKVTAIEEGNDGSKTFTVQAEGARKVSMQDKNPVATVSITKIVTASGASSAHEIFEEGLRQLQCVQASKITYDRLSAGSGKSNIDELAEDGVPGEVDYFVSHSWHDDKKTKFKKWEEHFGKRRQRKGRDAKVWLDEIIINQGNIEDSLKCLPVYLLACKKVLVLCGDTYSNRLWVSELRDNVLAGLMCLLLLFTSAFGSCIPSLRCRSSGRMPSCV